MRAASLEVVVQFRSLVTTPISEMQFFLSNSEWNGLTSAIVSSVTVNSLEND